MTCDPRWASRRKYSAKVNSLDVAALGLETLCQRSSQGCSRSAVPVDGQGAVDSALDLIGAGRRQLLDRQLALRAARVTAGNLNRVQGTPGRQGGGQVTVDAGIGPAVWRAY